jgi:hypothetical protein
MRKTIMLAALVALFGTGALAQAKDVTTTEQKTAAEATQTDTPAVRDENVGERRSAAHAQNREARDGAREHNDEASERHDDKREYGRRY